MTLHLSQKNGFAVKSGFTLIEVLVSMIAFSLLVSGIIYGYVQANRMAEWSSMSLAAQSYASQGLEQARSAQWDSQMWPVTNGPGTGDEMIVPTNYTQTDYLDVPTTGQLISITNYISVSNLTINPPLRKIMSRCVWRFPLTGQLCTNTVIVLRAPDE
jgi:prepilin-type N-terminal cleavage/methylation domain-containing protein